VVAGIGLRDDRGTSATFFGGTVSNTSRRAFGNVEYKPYAWLNLNGGGYFERDQLTGPAFSSRVGANFHLSNRHTIRIAYSQGTREPDIFEQRANWTYTATDLTPPLNGSSFGRFYQSARATGQLRDERIISREIGYVFREPAWGMLLDAKAFDDKLTDLISEKLQLQRFAPTNSNAVRLRGLELQTTLSPSHRWSLFLSYAFLRNSSTTELERTQYSSHSGAIGVSRALGDGWRLALAYYGATGDGLGQNYYGREDLTLSKTFKVAGKPLSTSITLRHLDNRSVSFFRDFGDVLVSTYDDSFQIYSYVKLSF
jgi:iron complex outermembrane receptor protein